MDVSTLHYNSAALCFFASWVLVSYSCHLHSRPVNRILTFVWEENFRTCVCCDLDEQHLHLLIFTLVMMCNQLEVVCWVIRTHNLSATIGKLVTFSTSLHILFHTSQCFISKERLSETIHFFLRLTSPELHSSHLLWSLLLLLSLFFPLFMAISYISIQIITPPTTWLISPESHSLSFSLM